MTLRYVSISVLAFLTLILPQFALARANSDDQSARLTVYVRTISTHGPAVDPWRFQVYVSGAEAHPYQFEGSSNGTTVALDANEDFEVSVSERYGYHARLSGTCDGELRRHESAQCYIVLSQEYDDYYPYPQYPYPQYPASPAPVYQQPVSLTANYIPTQFPNTGFDPSEGPAMLAFMAVLLLGAGFVVYPYARKITASLR